MTATKLSPPMVSPSRPAAAPAVAPGLDPDSRAWLEALRASGPERERAIERLGALLLSAARFEVRRRAAAAGWLRGEELDDIAAQSAHDALIAVLAKLDGFRGASRFTTWAYKFALLEAGVAIRRRAWQGREVVLHPEGWDAMAEPRRSPADAAETSELLSRISGAIKAELTPHQREVLIALAVDGVPIDVLAERLGTTRGALYKSLHDARRKLRAALAADGFEPGEGR